MLLQLSLFSLLSHLFFVFDRLEPFGLIELINLSESIPFEGRHCHTELVHEVCFFGKALELKEAKSLAALLGHSFQRQVDFRVFTILSVTRSCLFISLCDRCAIESLTKELDDVFFDPELLNAYNAQVLLFHNRVLSDFWLSFQGK